MSSNRLFFKQFPELAEIASNAIECGARHCQLTGSGPALFAIAADIEEAHFIKRKLQDKFDQLDCFICQSNNFGAKVVEAV